MSAARILLVVDNEVNLRVLGAILHSDHHIVATASSGRAAVESVRGDPTFDLVMLDVVLPDIDGIEVCRQLKGDPATSHIPIVLVSAIRTDDESIRRGLDAGADGYLVKPIEDIAVRAWVRATLRISRLQQELARSERPRVRSDDELVRAFAKLSHSVNNPLQALYAATDMLSLEVGDDARARTFVQEILIQAERVTQLVAQASHMAKDQLEKA